MKRQSLFSGKNKKDILNLTSAKYSQRVVIIRDEVRTDFFFFFMHSQEKS